MDFFFFLWRTFVNQLHDDISGVDVDCDQRSQRDPCLFGQFSSHHLHDIIELLL